MKNKKTHTVITPAGEVMVTFTEALEMNKLYGWAYRRIISKPLI